MCNTNTNHPRTRYVCRISACQQKSTRHKMSCCSPFLPAALPSSLSMASSATDPNRDTAAPYEPDGGVRRPGLRALRLVPFSLGCQNGAHLNRFVLMHKTSGDKKYVRHKHKSHFVFVLHKHNFSFANAPIYSLTGWVTAVIRFWFL